MRRFHKNFYVYYLIMNKVNEFVDEFAKHVDVDTPEFKKKIYFIQ